jgi:hypothetical protein
MLSCKEVSRLVSESLDHELPFGQRFSLRLHLLMCSLCSRFRRQILLLRRAARSFGKAGEEGEVLGHVRLSPEGRTRIKHALQHNGQ